jgi:hypothetical protein
MKKNTLNIRGLFYENEAIPALLEATFPISREESYYNQK